MSSFVTLDFLNSDSTCKEPVHVLSEIYDLQSEMIANRRWFHAHPEHSFLEYETAVKIVEILRSYGISEIFEKVGRTGVVALIRGNESGPCIALRADIDALPVTETASIDYVSQNVGVMHACGHDGHITGLLAAAKVLHAQKSKMKGIVKLLFQPAEEGYGGAKVMIEDGCLEDGIYGPRVDFVYGLHIWSYKDVGVVCCQNGPVMAACDKFTINVKGKGGHGAAPQGTVDAIVEAAQVVTSLQTIVSRNMDPLESGVVTCGTIKGGYGYNIIADNVEIVGTCRSFTPKMQELIKSRMNTICCGIAHTYGGEIKVDYEQNFPPTINSYPECNQIVVDAATKIVGVQRASIAQKTMISEDFSFFLTARPGCFFFIGAAIPGDTRPHHQAIFDFDERALLISSSVLVQIIRDQLF